MKRYLSAVFALASLFTVNTSSASILEVSDFTGINEDVADSFFFEEGGVGITVTAWVTNVNSDQDVLSPWTRLTGNVGPNNDAVGVYKGSTGLGVVSNENDGSHLDGGSSSDLGDLDEGLLFQFSRTIDFFGFATDYFGDDDDMNFSIVSFISPGVIETRDVFVDAWYDESGYVQFPTFEPTYGTAFMVWVDGNDDEVRIADLAFIAVPEPSSIALLSLSLFAFARTRKNGNR